MVSVARVIQSVRIDRLQAIAFVTGFALMAYELVASRLLAPSIGSSIYVWTSVIGVIIAALSAGFLVGGNLADKRTKELDIVWLLLACTLCVILTLPFSEILMQPIASAIDDARTRGLVISLLLFAPASFIFGVISPYLARLRNHSLKTTGRAVAGLSSLNALGGIAGTFFTGFVLFEIMGSREIVAAVAILLLFSSWLLSPREKLNPRIPLTVGLFLAAIFYTANLAQAANVIEEIDTPTAHYQITSDQYNGRPTRFLRSGPLAVQSGMYTDNPNELAFFYTNTLARLIGDADTKAETLFLGGGAFSLPRYIAANYPDSQVDVVEIDPKLVQVAETFFELKPQSNLKIYTDDARTYLNNASKQYDIIVVDVYHDSSVPFSLTTDEYVSELKRLLRPDGLVLVNVIGATNQDCKPFFDSIDRTYRGGFASSRYYPTVNINLNEFQNIIVAYGSKSAIESLNPASSVNYTPAPGRTLSDNYAPVESMWQRCLSDVY